MDAPDSCTEPVDYLLNQSGRRFNVLNFGMDAYGPGQSLLHYGHFRYARDLDYVVYVYYRNDLRDIFKNGLFSLDGAGNLVENTSRPSGGWVRFVSRLHLYVSDPRRARQALFSHSRAATGIQPSSPCPKKTFDTAWEAELAYFQESAPPLEAPRREQWERLPGREYPRGSDPSGPCGHPLRRRD